MVGYAHNTERIFHIRLRRIYSESVIPAVYANIL